MSDCGQMWGNQLIYRWLTLSCRRSIMAARKAMRFSSICSIFSWSFSSAIRLKLLFSSMALSSTSCSCSRFTARARMTCASWDYRGGWEGGGGVGGDRNGVSRASIY